MADDGNVTNADRSRVPVFILCGGFGTRLREHVEALPKPMVRIGNRPILWHIMDRYSYHGFKEFVLCLGYKAEVIKSYFLHYASLNSDFTVCLKTNELTMHALGHDEDWRVTLADTGESTMTGARIARAAERYLDGREHFAVTYGDGLTNANLQTVFEYHLKHGRIGTVLGVSPPSRFGEIVLTGEQVAGFDEKPEFTDKWINGGYFFFRRSFLSYLSQDASCVLERAPVVQLAHNHQLAVFKHHGYWACLDTQRDVDHLNEEWALGRAGWARAAR